jgi:chemotaxis protein methyltransferase CheR
MDFYLDFEIGIVDYRNILKVIKDVYGCDFNDYSLTSLKRRFEKVIVDHNLKHTDNLIEHLRSDQPFFEKFLQEISVEATEMFRDPSLWRYLRDDLLPGLVKDQHKIKIWFPSCVSGDELYTMAIVLKELGIENNVELIVSCINDLVVDYIKSGIFKTFKYDVSSENYSRFQGKVQFNDYIVKKGEQIYRDTSILKNVTFIKQNINFDNSPHDAKLVVYRNQLIYFNQTLQDKMLKIFYDSIIMGGYLIIGFKEQLGMMNSNTFKVINAPENVYKKL